MFSCEFCKISKNTFAYRTPPVCRNMVMCYDWLCIKSGIQERGTECRERGEWKECYIPGNVGMSLNTPGNVAKRSGKCPQTFRGMSSNSPGNVAEHSGECPQTVRGMSPNIPGNVLKHSGECPQTFWRMSPNIPGNVAKYSGQCPKTFLRMSPNIPGNVVKHFQECSRYEKCKI